MPHFLFTDIQESTQLWEMYGHEMASALAQHDALLQSAVARWNGRFIKHTGDGIFAAFEMGDQALQCAMTIQKQFYHRQFGAVGKLRIRVAVHAGRAEQRNGDYFGLSVNCTARLLTAVSGGQIILTEAAIAGQPCLSGAVMKDIGKRRLKGLRSRLHLFELIFADQREQKQPIISCRNGNQHLNHVAFMKNVRKRWASLRFNFAHQG